MEYNITVVILYSIACGCIEGRKENARIESDDLNADDFEILE